MDAAERETSQRLADQLQIHPLVAQLLCSRGIADPAIAQAFLKPRLTAMHDPALLPGCAAAARRLLQAVRAKQPIVVYGDYDVDGVTASAILWHMLKLAGADVHTYVPHRIEEGYGLNNQAVGQIASGEGLAGKPLIISVDCGITAIEPAAVAKSAGVDLIITDHHQFDPAHLPDACVLVHPQLPGSQYPFEGICGAGVAYKVAWQFARECCGSDRLPEAFRALLLDLLSLAALGTVADVVPLLDENRVIAHAGLGQIKRTGNAGLNALIDASRLRDEKIDAYHVGFVLGPRLNACGRMGHADKAVKLLTTAANHEALEIARFLASENERRRTVEREIFQQAKQMVLDHEYHREDCRAIVLGSEGWHQGVVGIVASRLVEAFHRPVVMLSIDDGQAHGSARSVEGVSIHEALQQCQRFLTTFGGHAMAAGMRLPSEQIDAFRAALIEFVNAQLPASALVGLTEIDALCPLEQINLPLFEQINQLEPFGRDNPTPVLCVERVRLEGSPMLMGAQGQHLRLTLRQDRHFVQAVGFGMGDLAPQLPSGALVDVAFEPKISTWQNRTRAELHIQDIRLVKASAHEARGRLTGQPALGASSQAHP